MKRLLVACVAISFVIIWFLGRIETHYHPDELVTAYASWSLPELTKIDWFGSYPKGWIAEFPVLFYLLQKPFFVLFGPTMAAVKISVWPYVIISIVYLYFLTKTLFSVRLATIATIIFGFLAPHLYIASLGVHFMSSTAIFLAVLYHWVRFLKTRRRKQAIITGILCGLSFLTYTASYITTPLVLITGLLHYGQTGKKTIIKGVVWVVVLTSVILLPFIIRILNGHNNFFLQRLAAVLILRGNLGGRVYDGIRALFMPGIGGFGYHFGRLAILDPWSAFLFFLGVFLLVARLLVKKDRAAGFLILCFMVPFVAGYILTNQPPAFHRLSLLYPLIAVFISLGIEAFSNKPIILLLLVSITIVLNVRHAGKMVQNDATFLPRISLPVAHVITRTVPPGSTILVVDNTESSIAQELFFLTNNRYRFKTSSEIMDGQEATLLIAPTGEIVTDIEKRNPAYVRIPVPVIDLGPSTRFVLLVAQ